MSSARRLQQPALAVLLFLFPGNPATAAESEAFPKHVREAFARYDEAARLIVEEKYQPALAALDGLGTSLPAPYAAKATAAGRSLLEKVIKPRFDPRSSYLRSRQRTLAAEVCLELHAYPEAAEIFEEVARDGIVILRDDAKIDVVRRAYRHAAADAVRYQNLFDRCQAVGREIYSRDLFNRDQESAGRRRSSQTLAELLDDLPAELPRLGLEEFHWLRMRKLGDAWPKLSAERDRAELLLSESARAIGDRGVVYASPDRPSPELTEKPDEDLATVALVRSMLEVDRVDAAATLCRELIREGRNSYACGAAVLETAEELVEGGRYDQALELYNGLLLAPQFSRADWKRQAAIAAYDCCVRKGDPQQGLQWAKMAVEHFHRGEVCALYAGGLEQGNAYLLAEAHLRVEPNDANIDAGFEVLVNFGTFQSSIGGLIAAEYARRNALDALERRIDHLETLEAAGKLPVRNPRFISRRPVGKEVVPGMRKQIELQRALSLGRWEPLWEHLLVGGRRVHEALGLLRGPSDELEDLSARQSAALLLDQPKETLAKIGKVRNIDDLKMGWKLYLAAALGRPGAAEDIRARFDTIAATPEANLPENYLDCMTALSALPKNERRELVDAIRSARYQLEKKHESDPRFQPVPLDRLEAVRRPRFLEQ